ncbi:histidine kinase [Rhodoferax lacus]|uniref:histidine kinase n=1 Tax=Rhodoferax lacus TaxID=2184758 RepID=A0A3E1RCY1_9BURK|nr:bacteriohemerythrin [Rhodoferax lacus]RFO97224.1 histidine kinase [Rhodoferax lacus]
MNLMAWSEHFVSGIDAVDAQHKALVGMINAAAPHLASGGEEAQHAVGPLLDKLVKYAQSHFTFEEELMQAAHVLPVYFEQHLKTHQAFVQEVVQMRAQYEKGESLSGNDLLHFLTSWLTFHILSEDKHMARQVLAIRAGETASQAFASLDTTQGAPQAVYNAALVDLFSLLTARNRTLTEANAQVRDAKRELESANTLLEARVSERTHELADANSALQEERQALVDSIARLKQTQAQLLQSEKMAAVGQLAAGVAHEINNPIGFVNSNLGTLSGYLDHLLALLAVYAEARSSLPAALLARLEALPAYAELAYIREDAPDLLRECREGLARVKRIVNDLRDFSHAGDGGWAAADINSTLESALNVVGNKIRHKATVVKEFALLPLVDCIASQLAQVFVNLLLNAAQAIEDTGTITLRTGGTADAVWIEISDTGVGMSEETQKHVFEPFYTTKPVGQGTGLGLSVSWDIVRRHAGSVELHSTLGQGTRVHITLPVSHAGQTVAA